MESPYQLIHTIMLPPDKLGRNIKQSILKICEDNLVGTCSPVYGHIIEITNLIDIQKGKVVGDLCYVKFLVKLNILVVKPEVGDKITGHISDIISDGCFILIGPIRIFVMIKMIRDGKCQFKNRNITNQKGSVILSKDDEVIVEIISIRFDKNGISCIGKC